MDKQTALKRLRKILGPKLMWREDPGALTGDVLAAAEIQAKAAREAARAASDALHERSVALLAGDAEYQRLAAAAGEARKARDQANWLASARRITVGTDGGIAFHVRAQADNWQDAVDQLSGRKA